MKNAKGERNKRHLRNLRREVKRSESTAGKNHSDVFSASRPLYRGGPWDPSRVCDKSESCRLAAIPVFFSDLYLR